MVYRLIRQLPELLFPACCRLCGDPSPGGLALCQPCRADLPWPGAQCRQCALPLGPAATDVRCGDCLRKPPAFDRSLAALRYAPPLDFLIKRLKFGHELALAPLLATLLLEASGTEKLPQALLPVPLHPARLRQRGFNQAMELARLPARRLGLPLLTCCRRVRDTRPQSQLSPTARRLNLRNAFAMTRAIPYRHVALVDDVMTSCQTANELARTLKAGGVEQVDVWVVARAG